MTHGATAIPEVQALLRVLATGGASSAAEIPATPDIAVIVAGVR